MERAIFPTIIIFAICFFGYKQYSRARTVAEINFKVDRMIEDGENYNTISSGMTSEQQQKMKSIRDSITMINNQNRTLLEQVSAQKVEIANLKDSLARIDHNYDNVVSSHVEKIEKRFKEIEDEIGILKGENEELRAQSFDKDAKIQELQMRLIAKTQEVDSLNQVIIEKNENILALTQKIEELQVYVNKINSQLPETLKAIESIKNELVHIDKILEGSSVFNRKKRMQEAQMSIQKVVGMYQRLNQIYETEYFNATINELAIMDDRLN